MPSQLTTKTQISGYRFQLRRLAHALIRRDIRLIHDPMRSQSRALAVGLVLGVLGLAGCAVLALLRPAPTAGSAIIIVGKDSGAMFVKIEDRIHPVLNLASARLISGKSEEPTIVKENSLASFSRGPLLGIPGAPQSLAVNTDGDSSNWTVCDSTVSLPGSDSPGGVFTTVVTVRPVLGGKVHQLGAQDSGLVSDRNGQTYLVYDGKRAPIDLSDPAVETAFHLNGVVPRPVSLGLLNSLAPVSKIAVPKIEGLGKQTDYESGDHLIGTVVRIVNANGSAFYVLLKKGIQRISPATVELLRAKNSLGTSEVPSLPPDILSRVKLVEDLPVDGFPDQIPTIVPYDSAPVMCLFWSRDDDGSAAQVRMIAGNRLPIDPGASVVNLATSDGPGDLLDQVVLPSSGGLFVSTTGIEAQSKRSESNFFITDVGVRFQVTDFESQVSLGIFTTPRLAPAPILLLLRSGPALSQRNALLAHEGMPADPNSVEVVLGE